MEKKFRQPREKDGKYRTYYLFAKFVRWGIKWLRTRKKSKT